MPLYPSYWPIRFLNAPGKMPLYRLLILGGLLIITFSSQAQTTESTQENATETTSVPPTEPATTSDNNRLTMRPKELLADALVDESHWLDTSEGKILVLYRRTEAKTTKGALLLLHAAEDPQVWPPALENLRRNLPKFGWETLAISLPQKYPQTVPQRDAASANTTTTEEGQPEESPVEENQPEENTSEETASAAPPTEPENNLPAREQLIKAYLLAALGFLNEKGQFNLVVLVDNSSFYWCMQLLSPSIKTNRIDPNTVDGPLQALVIANLQPQEPLTINELEVSLNQPQLPVLDIFFAPDSGEQKLQRELHKTVALRNKLDFYQQLSLEQQPKVIEADNASFLLGRVRGFMEKKAKGTEVDIKEMKKQK